MQVSQTDYVDLTHKQKARLIDKIVLEPSGCWSWLGEHNRRGYGMYSYWRENRRLHTFAHRILYFWLKGPIPKGKVIDHLCRNTGCCNPDHLEAVTPAENNRRSDLAHGVGSAKTHCVHGHEYTPENTYYRASGGRRCKTCRREDDKRRYYADLEKSRTRVRDYYARRREAIA